MSNDSMQFEATNKAQVNAYLSTHCNDGRCWLVSIAFGRVYATAYKYPSAIPYASYSLTDVVGYKYWRSGQWCTFPTRTIQRYENSHLGCE